MGFKLFVNNELAWESDDAHLLADELTVSSARGSHALVRLANDIDQININVSMRNPDDSNLPLDVREARARDERAAITENGSANAGLVEEGRNMQSDAEKRALLSSGAYPRDEDGNPVRSDGKGGLEKLADVKQLQEELAYIPTHTAGTANTLEPEPTAETETVEVETVEDSGDGSEGEKEFSLS